MLKKSVLASSIYNLTDARYFSAWEVEWIGFNLDKERPPFIDPLQLKAIIEWIEGPKIVGEFGGTDIDQITKLASELNISGIQINTFFPIDHLKKLKTLNKVLFQEIIIDPTTDLSDIENIIIQNSPYVDFFFFNLEANGWQWAEINTTHPAIVKWLNALSDSIKYYLSLKFKVNELDSIMNTLKPNGLSLSGGEEEMIGFKSFDELDEIFEELQIEQ